MYSSIRNSSDIFLLEVSEKHPKKAELTQVILGDHKTGEKYNAENFYAFKSQKSLVHCERKFPCDDYTLFFDQYGKEDIAEIKWILSGDSVLHNDAEAFSGILGLSNEYSSAGIDYCIQNYHRLLPGLLKLADSLNVEYEKNNVWYYNWRIKNLHAVIFSQSNQETIAYADKWLSNYTQDKSNIEWPGFLYFPHEGFFLSLLSNSSTKDLYDKKLRALLPNLGERNASTVFFALLESGSADPYLLEKEIVKEQRNAFAVALYKFNEPYNRQHDSKKANEYYHLALNNAEDSRLVEKIKAQIKD